MYVRDPSSNCGCDIAEARVKEKGAHNTPAALLALVSLVIHPLMLLLFLVLISKSLIRNTPCVALSYKSFSTLLFVSQTTSDP